MNQYKIRLTVDYTTVVEAETEDAAREAAIHIDVQDFDEEKWTPRQVLLIRREWQVLEEAVEELEQ